MANPKEMLKELYDLKYKVESMLRAAGHDWENVIMENPNDPDETFTRDNVVSILNKLDEINNKLDYLQKPIKEEGVLIKNSGDRYQIGNDGYEFTSGSTVEVLVYDDWYERENWVKTRVEHTNGDYYFYDLKEVPMLGSRVRKR